MTVAHYKGGHHPGNDLGLHYTALPPIVASCPYSDQLLVTRKFWSPGANRPSQANAQAPPPGSYTQTCWDIRMQGTTLTAVCRRAGGRGEQPTALNVARCVGDIGNNNGQLQCNGGQPAAPTPPRQGAAPGYLGPGYPPSPGTSYPPPGYGPDYRRSEAQAFR